MSTDRSISLLRWLNVAQMASATLFFLGAGFMAFVESRNSLEERHFLRQIRSFELEKMKKNVIPSSGCPCPPPSRTRSTQTDEQRCPVTGFPTPLSTAVSGTCPETNLTLTIPDSSEQ